MIGPYNCPVSSSAPKHIAIQSRETAMKRRIFGLFAIAAVAGLVGGAQALAQNAYITNNGDNTVSVIDTATNTVVGSPIPVGSGPYGVAVTPDGSKVYVTNNSTANPGTVSVIATATNTVTAMVTIGPSPAGVAVNPDRS